MEYEQNDKELIRKAETLTTGADIHEVRCTISLLTGCYNFDDMQTTLKIMRRALELYCSGKHSIWDSLKMAEGEKSE